MKDDFEGKTIEQANQALLYRSLTDAGQWVGEHAHILAKFAYHFGVSGTAFENVAVTIQMESGRMEQAVELLQYASDSVLDARQSTDEFDVHVLQAWRFGLTFSVRFVEEKA